MGFLTTDDIKQGRKVLGAKGPIMGRILTPVDMAGTKIRVAEDGEWYPSEWIRPVTEEQLHEDLVQSMVSLVSGKNIVNVQAKGKGVQFVLEDNTRVGLNYASDGSMKLSVIDPSGKQVL